jgi:hypothetical protein
MSGDGPRLDHVQIAAPPGRELEVLAPAAAWSADLDGRIPRGAGRDRLQAHGLGVLKDHVALEDMGCFPDLHLLRHPLSLSSQR